MSAPGQLLDARIVVEADLEEVDCMRLPGADVAAFSRRSPTRPTTNQDGYLLLPLPGRRAVFAVADGMGGLPAGEVAARLVLERIRDAVAAAAADRPLRGAVLDGLEDANRFVVEHGQGSGATVVVAEIDGRSLRTYHAGDAMGLVIDRRGRIRHMTVAHSPVGYLVESGSIDEEAALAHHERHLISNLVGGPEMRIEMGPSIALKLTDTVLIASDGLFDNLRLEEIVTMVNSGTVAEAAVQLIQACAVRMAGAGEEHPSKPDDLSFILYRRRRQPPRL